MDKEGTDRLIFLGGIDSKLWLDNGKQYSRNYKQGYRVYDSEGIANAITSNGGGLGGSSGLYLVREKKKERKEEGKMGKKPLIGVMGCVGSGKSTVLDYLKKTYACEVFVTDMIAYDIMRGDGECFKEILALFKGHDIKNSLGTLDSKKVGGIIFKDDALRRQMNQIVHPRVIQYVKDECMQLEADDGTDFMVVESALLIESGMHKSCDSLWHVRISEKERVKRLRSDRGYTRAKTNDILNGQLTDNELEKYADKTILNDGSLTDTYKQVDTILSGMGIEKKALSDLSGSIGMIARGL